MLRNGAPVRMNGHPTQRPVDQSADQFLVLPPRRVHPLALDHASNSSMSRSLNRSSPKPIRIPLTREPGVLRTPAKSSWSERTNFVQTGSLPPARLQRRHLPQVHPAQRVPVARGGVAHQEQLVRPALDLDPVALADG